MALKKRTAWWVPVILAAPVLLAACSGSDDKSPAGSPAIATKPPAEATAGATPTAPPVAAAIDVSSPSGIDGADPEFNYSAMVWQGYWLSRDHFGPLAMASGLGVPFEPPMEMVQAAMQMVGGTATDKPFVPDNIVPLQAVYRSGDTALAQDLTKYAPTDFAGMRLDPSTFEKVVGVEGQAQLMLKESQWARNFHTATHFGDTTATFGAQQRFMGMMVSMLAQMQGQYAMKTLMDPSSGLYRDSDGTLDYRGNWTMLQALADISGITVDNKLRYYNPENHQMFAMATVQLMNALAQRNPETASEYASAMRALSYVAWTADDSTTRDAALKRIGTLAASPPAASKSVDRAAVVVGLLSAANALGNGGIQASVRPHWDALLADFDARSGTFRSISSYTTDDVAWLIGGLNSLVLAGPNELRAPAAKVLVAFYEATLNQSGMQLSAPPGKDGAMAGTFEKDLPSVVYYHGRNTPPPPMAGGTFGRLTLPAAEIRFANGQWEVSNTRFESAGGMHLANELNWLGPHLGSVAFPEFRKTAAAGSGEAPTATTSLKLIAENVAFNVTKLVIPAGQEITLTFENRDQATPHNVHVSGKGVDAKTEIFAGKDGGTRTLKFTIAAPGEYEFVCDVHPNQMKGTITVK